MKLDYVSKSVSGRGGKMDSVSVLRRLSLKVETPQRSSRYGARKI